MADRFSAEQLLRDATGGSLPNEGDTLRRRGDTWEFTKSFGISIVSEDPAEPGEGQVWFNATDSVMRINLGGGTVLESPPWS